MKTKVFLISVLLMLCISIWITPQNASAQGGAVSFQVFYNELSPYGTWVNSPDYGYVWMPNVGPGFTPYSTNGYWVLTDEGWTWVSNYSWGWAPFHYGRWYNDPHHGFMWVPDNEWGPGWVTWRRSADYYGWAPIGPGVNINVAYSSGYNVPYNQWTFVRNRDFGRRDINNYYVQSSNNVTIIKNTTVINNTRMDKSRNVTYNAGPERNEVEKRAGKTFTPVTVKEISKPGQNLSNNQLQIYRPQVQKNISGGKKPAPSKVENLNNLKPVKEQTTSPQHGPAPAKQPQQQPKQNPAPAKQPTPPQHKAEPGKPQSTPPQHKAEPVKQQPAKQQPQHNAEPAKQPQQQPQHNPQPAKQSTPQQHNPQPAKQPQHNPQPAKQQPQPPKENPSQNKEEDNNPHKLL